MLDHGLTSQNPDPIIFPAPSLANVLNYFTTLDENDNTTGPDNTLDPRGADNIEEFNRQTEKLVTALTQLDADVIGLAELENNGFANLSAGNSITGKSAIATLVDELNAVEGAVI